MEIETAMDKVAELIAKQPDGVVLVCLPLMGDLERAADTLLENLVTRKVGGAKLKRHPFPTVLCDSGGRAYFRTSYDGGNKMRGICASLGGVLSQRAVTSPLVVDIFENAVRRCSPENVFYVS